MTTRSAPPPYSWWDDPPHLAKGQQVRFLKEHVTPPFAGHPQTTMPAGTIGTIVDVHKPCPMHGRLYSLHLPTVGRTFNLWHIHLRDHADVIEALPMEKP